MATFKASKVISALPSVLSADTLYLVRVGEGFDLYCTDSTGSIAHTLNSTGEALNSILEIDGGSASATYILGVQELDGGDAKSFGVFPVADVAETDADTVISGNVLLNDENTGFSVLIVIAVNGSLASVGQTVVGSNGGEFVINADGSWTFDPAGDFAALAGSDTATTSVSYHASDGDAEAMATLTVTVSSADVETDPYWQYVELYLPMTGANGGTSFTDVAKGRTVTRNAPLITQAGTGPQSEASYAYYTSGSDTKAAQLSVPNHATLNLGNKDFCAEWFYRPTTLPASKNHPRFFDKRGSTNNYEIMLAYYSGVLYFYVSADGTSLTKLINGTAWSPTLNQWYHMRVSRNGSTWRLWINGQKFWEGTWAGTIFAGAAPFTLMGDGVNVHRGTWSMSHFRLTVGHSRETTDVIDVPTLPYPTI